MAHIHDHDGYFIAPAPMYESYKKAFLTALDNHHQERLIPYKDQINRGLEAPFSLSHNQKEYEFRMIILYDQGLASRKRHALHNRAEKTRQAFAELTPRLNACRLKTKESIEQACNAILRKYQSAEFFTYTISNDPVVTYKTRKKVVLKRGKSPRRSKSLPIISA
jgi:transposase